MKYIVVTGGVLSGLGKGITTSSIGRLLKARGVRLAAVKIDPYVNCDAGTMNPFEHGEVFVLDDGGEVDLDLGNYERFLSDNMSRQSNITTGTVYKSVIEKERRGDYLGKTVQIIPHVTNEIRERVKRVAKDADAEVCLIEVGGTVGDIESMPFLEALRQLRIEAGRENMVFIHTTLVPVLGVVGEQKTKPTQTSVKELRSLGIDPEMIVCRSSELLEPKTKAKIALFCDVDERAVIGAPDARTIYEVPMTLAEQGVDEWLIRRLSIEAHENDLSDWRSYVERIVNPKFFAEVYVVGKYTHLADSYLSITEAFTHAGAELNTRVKVRWVDAEQFEKDPSKVAEVLQNAHGILVPGGFGSRATEGKMLAIKYAREAEIPFLGICFGFQLATCEFARSVCDLQGANSTEVNPDTQHPVIDILPEQRTVQGLGGTMRLGASPIKITPNSRAHQLYGKTEAAERHRHRYEVNPGYIPKLEAKGLRFVGKDPTGNLMEILELPYHPFFVGSQFHPEFMSRPMRPAPLFHGFVEAAKERMLRSGIHEAVKA